MVREPLMVGFVRRVPVCVVCGERFRWGGWWVRLEAYREHYVVEHGVVDVEVQMTADGLLCALDRERGLVLERLDDPAILDAVERAIARSARPPHEAAVAAVRRHLAGGVRG